jgi:predicted ATPase
VDTAATSVFVGREAELRTLHDAFGASDAGHSHVLVVEGEAGIGTDEGLHAAAMIRERQPTTAVLLLSSYLDVRYATTLFTGYPAGTG